MSCKKVLLRLIVEVQILSELVGSLRSSPLYVQMATRPGTVVNAFVLKLENTLC